MKKSISIIGGGNLGLAILNGLLEQGIPGKQLTVTRRHLETIEHYREKGVTVTSDNAEAIQNSHLVIVCLKPYNILENLREVSHTFDPEKHVLVSVATGISLQQLREAIGHPLPVFRAMPNTAADVSESLTCIASDNGEDHMEEVMQIFNSIGASIRIEENLMDAATVLGACGIAYVLRFIRSMIQGGIQIGFDAKTAGTIVNQTVLGASKLLIERDQHPEQEIDKVTTPKGCTIVGLNEMEHNGFSSSLIKGIVASFEEILTPHPSLKREGE